MLRNPMMFRQCMLTINNTKRTSVACNPFYHRLFEIPGTTTTGPIIRKYLNKYRLNESPLLRRSNTPTSPSPSLAAADHSFEFPTAAHPIRPTHFAGKYLHIELSKFRCVWVWVWAANETEHGLNRFTSSKLNPINN